MATSLGTTRVSDPLQVCVGWLTSEPNDAPALRSSCSSGGFPEWQFASAQDFVKIGCTSFASEGEEPHIDPDVEDDVDDDDVEPPVPDDEVVDDVELEVELEVVELVDELVVVDPDDEELEPPLPVELDFEPQAKPKSATPTTPATTRRGRKEFMRLRLASPTAFVNLDARAHGAACREHLHALGPRRRNACPRGREAGDFHRCPRELS